MESSIRKPFQGVLNIVRFNWHFYVLSAMVVVCILIIQHYFDEFSVAANFLMILVLYSTLISLAVSTYIYDFSDLYKLSWLNNMKPDENETIININAGFDETSILIQQKFIHCAFRAADFYEPSRHTEVSIKRARNAYPPFPNTLQVSTSHFPVADNSVDNIFAILSAHEIRSDEERTAFFMELNRILKPSGQIVVTEHLRNTANFLAYNIGFFHFHSKATWLKAFHSAGLDVSKEIKITPFITTFFLQKNGTTS